MAIRRFLIRDLADQERIGYIQSAERNWQPRIVNAAKISFKNEGEDFPGGAAVENLPANAGDTGSIPGPGRSHILWSN